jgi:hypothetical protein
MPTDFNVLYTMGSFYLRVKNDRKKANEYFYLLLKYHPTDARTYYNIGGALLKEGYQKGNDTKQGRGRKFELKYHMKRIEQK